jgi:signal transduction histidine kinase
MELMGRIAGTICAARAALARSRAIRDLIPVGVLSLATFVVSASLDLNERLMQWLLDHDGFGLVQLPLVFLVTCAGFGWYSLRRWREYKQELERRRALELRLRIAAEQAEMASRAKSDFLANMSHELRTPLNGILGFSEALADGHFGALTPRQRGYIRDIHDSGVHLLKIINDILDMSKLDAGRMTLNEEIVDVAGIAESCLRLVRHRTDAAGIVLSVEAPMSLPKLRADELRLRQIVLNLVSNAVKFTPANGRVSLRMEYGQDGAFLLKVSDTGIGMREADIAIALTPFAQVENFLTRKHEGTGLGLPIVSALVELHGGRLDIRSTPGRGTTVTVALPKERIIRDLHAQQAA